MYFYLIDYLKPNNSFNFFSQKNNTITLPKMYIHRIRPHPACGDDQIKKGHQTP